MSGVFYFKLAFSFPIMATHIITTSERFKLFIENVLNIVVVVAIKNKSTIIFLPSSLLGPDNYFQSYFCFYDRDIL